MKFWALIAVLALPVSPVLAQSATADTTARCADGSYSTAKSRKGACASHGGVSRWIGSSKAERRAARNNAPDDATALCKDGSYSESTTRKGACSAHGGVSEWFAKRTATRDRTPANRSTDNGQRARRSGGPDAPDDASARCNDGTYSDSQHREGTCSYHGGVAEWLKDIPKE